MSKENWSQLGRTGEIVAVKQLRDIGIRPTLVDPDAGGVRVVRVTESWKRGISRRRLIGLVQTSKGVPKRNQEHTKHQKSIFRIKPN